MYGPDREGEELRTPAEPKTEVACLVDRRKFFRGQDPGIRDQW